MIKNYDYVVTQMYVDTRDSTFTSKALLVSDNRETAQQYLADVFKRLVWWGFCDCFNPPECLDFTHEYQCRMLKEKMRYVFNDHHVEDKSWYRNTDDGLEMYAIRIDVLVR